MDQQQLIELLMNKAPRKKQKCAYPFNGEEDLYKVQFATNNSIRFYESLKAWGETKLKEERPAMCKYFEDVLECCEGEEPKKSVCAKIITRGEVIAECYDCRADQSCVICLECFKAGNHEGHKVIFKKAYGGCCDCGDPEAWKPSGFCSEHTGEEIDLPIAGEAVEVFVSRMQDIFYLYYRAKMGGLPSIDALLPDIMSLINRIIDHGIRGIKLISILFQSEMRHRFSCFLKDESILTHLLNHRFMGEDLRQWEEVFIRMFPYYEFKKQLTAAYFELFPKIYSSEEGQQYGQSLSCQILTSYRLIEDYISQPSSRPLGFTIQPDFSSAQLLNTMLLYDLNRISELQEPVPYKYWRFHLQHGIEKLFFMHERLKMDLRKEKKANKVSRKKKKRGRKAQFQEQQEQFSLMSFVIVNCRRFQDEFSTLTLIHTMLQAIMNDKPLILELMRQLVELITNDHEEMLIFRPYHRAFGLALFFWADMNLSTLEKESARNCLLEGLQMSSQEWEVFSREVQDKMLPALLFSSQTVSNDKKGYDSSFYPFLYFYRIKDRFLASIDTIILKSMALLSHKPYTIDPSVLVSLKMFETDRWDSHLVKLLLGELNMLYLGNFAQIFLAYYDEDKPGHLFQDQIAVYLCKFITAEGGSVSLQRAKQFSRAFLFDNEEALKKHLTAICTYNRPKKVFILKEQNRDELGLNYADFEMRASKFQASTKEQLPPSRTLQLVQGYNAKVIEHFWGFASLQEIQKVFLQVFATVSEGELKDSLIDFMALVYKFMLIVKQTGKQEQADFVEQMLLRLPVSQQVKQSLQSYKELFGGMEEEGAENAQKELSAKKEMLRAKKLKKLEELKMKKQANLNLVKQTHEIEEESHQEEEKLCVICHSQDKSTSQMVVLTRLTFRDMDRLMGHPSGIQTMSFTSCNHPFHHSCILKTALSKNLEKINFKCPLCRKQGNTFFPFNQPSQAVIDASLERLMLVAMSLRNLKQIDQSLELIKSVYHYVMLGEFEPHYVSKQRLPIYQRIIDLLSSPCLSASLLQNSQKIVEGRVELAPFSTKVPKPVTIPLMLQNAEEQIDLEFDSDSSDEDYDDYEDIFVPVHRGAGRRKNNKQKGAKKAASSMYNVESHPIFHYSLLRTAHFILSTAKPQFDKNKMVEQTAQKPGSKQDQHEEILSKLHAGLKAIQDKVPDSVRYRVGQLIGQTTQMEPQAVPLRLKIRELPNTFYFDLSKNQCDSCQQIVSDLFLCMLCAWRGCLNCNRGGAASHIKTEHGDVSAFFRLKDGCVYTVAEEVKKVGCLYANEWGEELSLKKDWSSYTMQQDVYDSIAPKLLRDE